MPTVPALRTTGALAHSVQVGALARVGEAPLAPPPAPAPDTMTTIKTTALGTNQPLAVGAASAIGGAAGYLLGFGWLGALLGTAAGNIAARFGAKQYCKTHPGTDCDPNAGA